IRASGKGVGTCWTITRIISSGVMPLATVAATNEPALVPTYTSNSFTVRLTERRSSARRAPISYTPPVNPPPPSTSAVFERRRRARPLDSATPFGRSEEPGWSLTTFPISAGFYEGPPPGGLVGPGAACPAEDGGRSRAGGALRPAQGWAGAPPARLLSQGRVLILGCAVLLRRW